METTAPQTSYRTSHPILLGVLIIAATIATGSAIAFTTGLAQPQKAEAFIPLPPCCTLPPILPPVLPPPPPPPPIPLPPCCTEPAPTPMPAPLPPPAPIPLPPCCTVPPVTPPVIPPAPIPLPPCCTLPPVTPPVIPPASPAPIPLPPCCTVPPVIPPIIPPTVPPPPVIPPVIPPPVVPPPPPPTPQSSSCTYLNADKSVISAPGEAVTLTWQTDNGTPVTVTNVTTGSTVTTSTNTSGTVTVNPSGTTTYHASVPSDMNNVHCTVTVTYVPPTTNPSSCQYLSIDKSNIASGDTVTLKYQVNNATPVTITNVTSGTVIKTTNDQTGTFTDNPTKDTMYHVSVPSDQNNANCTASVHIVPPQTCSDTGTCGGGGGGGGSGSGSSSGHGSSHRNVYFSSTNRETPPLSSVYLSEIPYTGLDLGPVGTIVYWAMLVIWSLAAAYLVLFGLLPFMKRKFATFGSNVNDVLNSQPAALLPAHAGAGIAYAMPVGSVHAAPRPSSTYQGASVHQAVHAAAVAAVAPVVAAPVMERTAPAPRMEMSGEGFKKFATNGALTIDDIVKGLSRESGMEFSNEAPEQHAAPVQEAAHVEYSAPVQAPAPVYEAPRAQASAPRVAAVHPDVIAFIGSILAGERDSVFATIRHLNQAGHDAEEFVSHAILALDDAYKARIDGTPVHEDVARATSHCATSFLEKLVTSLTTAVDGSYSMGVTGIKLALTRALAVAQG